MNYCDTQLQDLVTRGRTQGYLTYDEVNKYLPDEAVSPEKLDLLIVALEDQGIELVDEPAEESDESNGSDADRIETPQPLPYSASEARAKLSDDPIRMYLTQMAEIPLLTREQEISLAKKIEVSRKRFRRTVLGCDFAMRATVDTLQKVYQGDLPFDRTIKVSLTERLTKLQISARMPHNLNTIRHLLECSRLDFATLVRKSTTSRQKAVARRAFLRRRAKLLTLVEELSLRTRRVQPLVRQLQAFSSRMTYLRERLGRLQATDQPASMASIASSTGSTSAEGRSHARLQRPRRQDDQAGNQTRAHPPGQSRPGCGRPYSDGSPR